MSLGTIAGAKRNKLAADLPGHHEVMTPTVSARAGERELGGGVAAADADPLAVSELPFEEWARVAATVSIKDLVAA